MENKFIFQRDRKI